MKIPVSDLHDELCDKVAGFFEIASCLDVDVLTEIIVLSRELSDPFIVAILKLNIYGIDIFANDVFMSL